MPDARPRGDWLLMAVLVAIVLGVTVWVATAQPRVTYSIGVDEALSRFARYRERRVRVRGVIVPGSVVKRARDCDVKFKLAPVFAAGSAQGTLHVHYTGCSLPEGLCDLSGPTSSSDAPSPGEVHAEGRLSSPNGRIELDAEELVVMCPGKYYAQGPPLCARYQPGDDCPICEHALTRQRRSLSPPM
jgi:cytochrome c-type biogenesis protein CcmE